MPRRKKVANSPHLNTKLEPSADNSTDLNIDVNANTATETNASIDTDAESNVAPVYRILDLQESERPRERLIKLGPQVLTNAELIAILIRVGVKGENSVQVGQRLLNTLGGLTGLHRAPFVEIKKQRGLGKAKVS